MKKQRNIFVGGLSLVLMTTVSSVAMAQCVGTGEAGRTAPNFAPFAVGGALNTLVSSINAANTAFLTQSTAFVGSPANPKPDQEGGGIWARGIGGEIKTNSTVTSTYAVGGNGSVLAPVANPLTGNVVCNTSTNLQFAGTQVGTDMARLNWNGWNVHMGSMAGYLGARARDTTAGSGINAPGSLTNSLEVPFVGAYAAATYGSFFIDGQIRWDFYQNTINDPIQNGLFNQKLDARGVALTANAGYNFQLGNNWFIEPSAGMVISQVKVDPLTASGTFILPGNGFSLPNTTSFSKIDSYLGRLSVRVGTTIVSDKMIWQPFVTASVYHDFAGNARAAYSESLLFEAPAPVGTGPILTGNLSATNLGTYGQFAVGVAGQVVGTGWLGYLRADYRSGDRIEGYSLNGGLRYQFTPEMLALAPKGLITKAPALAAAPYNWNGFYIGAQFGGLNGWTDWTFPGNGATTDPRLAGANAGGQIGYDWQMGKWVVGLEGSMTWTNANGARSCPNGILFTCQNTMDWFATGTARVGYALWDRAIVYVKGGVAAAEIGARGNCNTGTSPTPFVISGPRPAFCTTVGADIAPSETAVGWTIGYGTEFALAQNWTVKGETTYFDLGRTRFNLPNNGPIDVKTTGMTGIVGLNYRFATGGPIR